MKRDRSSNTAEYTAAMRADHRLHDADPVFDDPWALQLLALAAGLDSSCLRRDPRVRVIEVDHPASQRAKRERLAALGATLDGVEFASVDFEREDLAAALARSSLDRAQPAFVTWIGVTM